MICATEQTTDLRRERKRKRECGERNNEKQNFE
jgi:hypothetical protein